MACTCAPACKTALAEATRLFPGRSTASDGCCASAEHTTQNPTSDHEPDADGLATAFDITDDPAHGCDSRNLLELLRVRRDPRVKYAISDHEMWSSYATSTAPAFTWRPYSGTNPHTKHGHVSVLQAHKYNADPWFDQEDDMTEAEVEAIVRKVVADQVTPLLGRLLEFDMDEFAPLAAQVEQACGKAIDAHGGASGTLHVTGDLTVT